MIDVIIATYNRFEKAKSLALAIVELRSHCLNNVIIVDSTDNADHLMPLFETPKILYFHSSHKNQPYQRYLGYINSLSEYLVFLDDDMEIVSDSFLDEIRDLFITNAYAAIALKFKDKHDDTSLSKIPATTLFESNSKITYLKNVLSGYTPQEAGTLGYNGIRGKQPAGGGFTEYVSGGAFAAQRKYLYENFNFQLFDLYESGLGKGEDAIMGYTLSKQSQVFFYDKLLFLHNDTNTSVYSTNHYSFAKRVSFSRLYLSLEKARLNNESLLKGRILYHYYTFWRTTGYLINYIIKPKLSRRNMFKGSLAGWWLAFKFKYRYSEETNNYWKNESNKDSNI
jgi:glycosyltransferase involved in cell wall biosynthesis